MKHKVLILLFAFTTFTTWGQKEVEKTWESFQKDVEYGSASNKENPTKENIYPDELEDFDEADYYDDFTNQVDEDILDNREGQFGPYKGKGGIKQKRRNSTSSQAPDLKSPDPIDIDVPEIDTPDVDMPDVSVGERFWKILLVIIVLAIIMVLLYYFFFRNVSTDQKVEERPSFEREWNPVQVTKSELELKLEEFTAQDDYRSCVRVYYTFILQSLISKGWIRWKQDKTNNQYLIEMLQRPLSTEFSAAVRLFELVWYGNYSISNEDYAKIEPQLKNLYKTIDSYEGE